MVVGQPPKVIVEGSFLQKWLEVVTTVGRWFVAMVGGWEKWWLEVVGRGGYFQWWSVVMSNGWSLKRVGEREEDIKKKKKFKQKSETNFFVCTTFWEQK